MECISCGYPLAGPHYACGHCAKIARIAELETSLKEINEIRNSIVGLQTVNWSEHIYPLVASLDKAGMVGMEYPEARGKFGTMLERAVSAEKQLADLRGDRDTLAGEVEARRDKSISIGPASSSMGPYREAYWKLEAAIIKTDASGALTRAGKDHT